MSKLSIHKPSLEELVNKYFDTGYVFGYDLNTAYNGMIVKATRNPLILKDTIVNKQENLM
jgi:hypothetical protein